MQVTSTEWIGNWQKRILAGGWIQFREGGKGAWKFHVSSFHPYGNLNACNVHTVEGKREAPIDNRDRILIEGRWYGRKNWDH